MLQSRYPESIKQADLVQQLVEETGLKEDDIRNAIWDLDKKIWNLDKKESATMESRNGVCSDLSRLNKMNSQSQVFLAIPQKAKPT